MLLTTDLLMTSLSFYRLSPNRRAPTGSVSAAILRVVADFEDLGRTAAPDHPLVPAARTRDRRS